MAQFQPAIRGFTVEYRTDFITLKLSMGVIGAGQVQLELVESSKRILPQQQAINAAILQADVDEFLFPLVLIFLVLIFLLLFG